jgi:hypothetical protein
VDASTVDTPLASITGTKGIVVNSLGGNDSLTLDYSGGNPLPPHGLIDSGGAGTDTLVGSNADTIWSITGANTGNIAGLGVTFNGAESLTGGSGRDVFHFAALGGLSGAINAGAGNNWLDFSASGSVVVNLTTGVASHVAGGVHGVNNVIGSAAGASKLTGNSSGGVLLGKGTGNTIIAGAGRTLIIGGIGVNTLKGGAADDLIVNGRTTYDGNFATLEAILSIWQDTAKSYSQRIAALQAAGPDRLAIGVSVFVSPGQSASGLGPRLGTGNFVYQSTIYGNGGSDWFITKLKVTVFDLATGEVLTLP